MSKKSESEKSQTITFQLPSQQVAAFIETTNQFFAQTHGGRTAPAQQAAEVHARDRHAAFHSLSLLFQLAENDSVHADVIARFLAGLYDGQSHPFDLTELRRLDEDQIEHCLAVLRLDGSHSVEVQNYFPDADARWRAMIRRCWAHQNERGTLVNQNDVGGQTYACSYVAYSDAPGYRDVTLFASVRGEDHVAKAIGLSLSTNDCARLAEDLTELHRRAWESGTPKDAEPGEQRPEWLIKD